MYDEQFYDIINDGSLRSAAKIVPRVLEVLDLGPGATVLDVGCGEGAWLSVFEQSGCTVTGIDGEYVDQKRLFIVEGAFNPLDLNMPLETDLQELGPQDLTISLEVAEHLRPDRALSFVNDLCSTSDVILFSAAVPGQGGVGHRNEQWPSYWVEMFEENGYTANGGLRWEFWDDPDVENWYKANMILFHKRPINLEPSPPIAVVHPVLFAHIAGVEYGS